MVRNLSLVFRSLVAWPLMVAIIPIAIGMFFASLCWSSDPNASHLWIVNTGELSLLTLPFTLLIGLVYLVKNWKPSSYRTIQLLNGVKVKVKK